MKTHHILAHAMKRCVRPRAAIIEFSYNSSGDYRDYIDLIG